MSSIRSASSRTTSLSLNRAVSGAALHVVHQAPRVPTHDLRARRQGRGTAAVVALGRRRRAAHGSPRLKIRQFRQTSSATCTASSRVGQQHRAPARLRLRYIDLVDGRDGEGRRLAGTGRADWPDDVAAGEDRQG